MQIYLLTINLLALAALLVGLSSMALESYSRRLLPLFLLVISRSLSLIIFLATLENGRPPALMNALEGFSAFCLVWTLVITPGGLPTPWSRLVWPGTAAALFLILTPLLPGWPVPVQLHVLTIVIFGAPFVLAGAGQRGIGWLAWLYLSVPLLLALAAFLALLALTSVSWLVTLLAYGLLVTTLVEESVVFLRQRLRLAHERQQAAEALLQETVDLNRERERLLGLSETIGTMPHLGQAMEHIVSSVARATRVDQSALLTVDLNLPEEARLVAVYSPVRPVHLNSGNELVVKFADYPLLERVLTDQQQLLLPHPYVNGLKKLYALWDEDRAGPTLLQPLLVQGRPVGVLVLGNPITQRPVLDGDAYLCRALAPQIAAVVEHHRRYQELELQAEMIAAALTQQPEALVVPPDHALGDGGQEYLELLEIVGDGVVVSDTAGRVCLVNGAAERILGRARRDLLGQPISSVYGEIDSGEAIDNLMVAFSRRNQPLPTFVERNDRAIQGRLVPWRNQTHEWLGIVAVFRDVTREVKADRARNEFIAGLSRELRAPLTAVKGYSDLLLQGALGDYSAEQLRIQRIIQSSADRMAAVLDNAIQITAQNKNRVLPRFEEVDVVKIIDEALRDIAPLAKLNELTLSREVKDPLPPIVADPQHLRRILDNLLVNACHFTLPGGYVSVRAWVQSEREGNTHRSRLLLAVADNGVGIPPPEQKRIFDPFYQLKEQNVPEQRGMGVGLTVVKELVELHQGRVWVESIGKGSIFQVALPLTQE